MSIGMPPSPIGSALRTAMTKLTGKSAGDQQQAFMQALGMDQRSAALHGAMHDLKLGDLAGYQKNMFEAFSGVDPGRMTGMSAPHSMCSPSQAMGSKYERMDLAKMSKGGLGSILGGAGLGFALGGPLGGLIGGFAGGAIGKRLKGKALENRLNREPQFRAQFEAATGGRYVPDGRSDGKITIARPNFGLPGLNPGMFGGMGGNPIVGSALSGLARHMAGINAMMQGMGGMGAMGAGIGGMNSGVAPGIGTHAALRTGGYTGGPQGGSEMSKLGPGATFEDKIAAFMIDQAVKMQKEIEDQMAELEASDNSGGIGGKKGLGGALGGILGGLGSAAGFVGGNMLLPGVGGMIGSQLGGQLGGAIGGNAGGQASKANGADETGNQRQIMFEKLKNKINVMQQMIQAMSNVLNTMHQGSMNAIRNIRG